MTRGQLLARLRRRRETIDRRVAELDALYGERHDDYFAGREMGLTLRELADAAGVTEAAVVKALGRRGG